MTQMSTRRSAAAAARELMSGKMKTVEDLAAALDTWQASRAAVEDAVAAAERKAADARAAHETARNAGWTVAELRSIGLEPPALPRRRRGAATSDDADTTADSSTPEVATGDASGDDVAGPS